MSFVFFPSKDKWKFTLLFSWCQSWGLGWANLKTLIASKPRVIEFNKRIRIRTLIKINLLKINCLSLIKELELELL